MKTILVALDSSPRNVGVLDAALALALKTEAKLILFRSVEVPHGTPENAFAMAFSKGPVHLEEQARRDLLAFEGSIFERLRGGIRVVEGEPWAAIVAASEDAKVDLIVIGSHGYGPFDRLLGTTASKVVNHAKRSVLVVRAPELIGR